MTDLLFPKPEPKRYDGKGLKLGLQLETLEHIAWRVEKEHYDRFNSIPQDKRQEALDLFHKGGITIAEVGEKTGINSETIASIIFLNIQNVSFLPEKSL